MKNRVAILVSGSALMWATPSLACQFDGQKNVNVGALMVGDPSAAGSAKMEAVIEKLWARPGVVDDMAKAGCTKTMLSAEMTRINGSDSERTFLFSEIAAYPLAKVGAPAVMAAKPEPVAVTKVQEPVTQVVVQQPVAEPSAELRRTQADLNTAKQQQAVLKAQVAAIAARPTNTQLSPEDRAKVNQLLDVNKVVKDLEAVVKRLSVVEADVLTLQNDMGKKANKSELDALGNRVADLENAPPVTETGWTWKEWTTAGISAFLLILALAFGVFATFFRKPKKADVRAVVDEALKDESLGHTVFRAELDALKGEVEKLSTDVADSAKDHKQVELPANLEEQLKALGDGESTEIIGTISGNRGLIGFTKSGDNFVTTTDIDQQTQPMNIEKISKHGCGIRSTLLRHIGAGRVKLRPIAQAVNS